MDEQQPSQPLGNGTPPPDNPQNQTAPSYQPTVIVPGQTSSVTNQTPPADVTSQSNGSWGDMQPSATPVLPSAPQQSSNMQPEYASVPQKKARSSKLLLPVALVAVLLVGGSAAAYITFFQKSPEKMWASAMRNTADGFTDVLKVSSAQGDKGMALSGKFKISSPLAVDGSMEGTFSGGNTPKAEVSANVGVAGLRAEMELRALEAAGSTSPDIYLKVDGLEGLDELLSQFGSSAAPYAQIANNVNGNWYVIDHTLLDQAAQGDEPLPEISQQEIDEAIDKTATVFSERFFATDDKAVFELREELGEEQFEGDDAYKVRVGINKENLKTFITTLRDELQSTQAVTKLLNDETNLNDILSIEDLLKTIDEQDFSNATADVWIAGNGGFIRNVRIYPVSDKKDTNYLDFGLDYAGGDTLPLAVKATIDDDGVKGSFAFGLDMNRANAQSRWWFNVDLIASSQPIAAEGELTASFTDESVDPQKPADAKNILELINGFTGVQGASSDDTMNELDRLPFSLDDIEL